MIGPEALAIIYGLSSAIAWGTGDFSAGFASRKSGVISVILFSQLIGAVFLFLLAMIFSGSLLMMSILFIASSNARVPQKSQLSFIALTGICDVLGNMFFALATSMGRLDISAMLSSLFPAATVMLAWFFLKEKLNRHQWCGVVVALVALFLIST